MNDHFHEQIGRSFRCTAEFRQGQMVCPFGTIFVSFCRKMINQQAIPIPPQLSKRAFWDTELAALDFSKHAKFIITRVFERGTPADQQALLRYYGAEGIIAILKNASSLLPIARERAKHLFHLSDPDFACYKSKLPVRNSSRY